MASSGWQGEQTIYAGGGSAPRLDGDLYISSITHSGSDLRVTGQVEVINPASGSINYNGAYIWCSGGWSTTDNLNSNYGTRGTWYYNFDVTIGGVSASSTSYTFSMGVNAVQSGGSISWTIYFDQSGTAPSTPTATLVAAGPDWADIDVSITSWGSPSGSASRYIEAAVLGSSSYGAPYRYKQELASMSKTFHVDNSGYGGLTITPNTQYRYGGYVSNTVMNASTVGGTFTTLPAVPVINALDQGHGAIDVTVTHANEGSAETVTEEYSIDGGTTWTTITGGVFTLNLSTQTALTVRRSSTAGVSSDTVTVTPQFDVAIYGSVMNQSRLITKAYASMPVLHLATMSVSNVSYMTINTDVFMEKFNSLSRDDSRNIIKTLSMDGALTAIDVSSYGGTIYINLGFGSDTVSWITDSAELAEYGIVMTGPGSHAYADCVTTTVTVPDEVGYSKKVAKIYASVAGKTKLVFEDPS